MIRTIIFDLAEVYLKGFMGIEHHLEAVLNIDAKEIWNKLRNGSEFIELMTGKITEDEFWKKVLIRNRWNVEILHLKKAIRNNFCEIKGTRKIIETLKSKGYKLGLLSDHSKENRHKNL
ncbi:hypothetical protein HYX19_02420 [Candidatus Woesearchaeota archaeon]|nr:hypothetical protein [Candidatus Woesearchaeota archaeon]